MTRTSSRKLDHLRICATGDVERGRTGFDDVHLVHEALPECTMDGIDISTSFLGHRLASPLFIAGMTGGHPETEEINRRVASAAEHFGMGMGVGSQRAALENRELEDSFTIVRETAPHAFLCANLGIVQLRDHGIEWAERAVEMIDAQALVIHLNFLQEAIQPEGNHNAIGCLDALQGLCREYRVPVIVKETGAGISGPTARKILGAGAKAIDIGGSGGTSWAAVEVLRAPKAASARTGHHFLEWGIPTVVSLIEVAETGAPVIATGGVRTGIDIAKSLALGATLAGMALPLFRAGMKDTETLFNTIEGLHQQLRVAMFLTGSRVVQELRRSRPRLTGPTRQMLESIREESNGY
ncbi:MAG: type 2 isopentenyl-diphosphate Delta-isomerase [Methanomicrobiales archaeon]|nr:type 2 isopentenyl-diphosphate Delta-isomerase [Methanomicrobiales archaeon]